MIGDALIVQVMINILKRHYAQQLISYGYAFSPHDALRVVQTFRHVDGIVVGKLVFCRDDPGFDLLFRKALRNHFFDLNFLRLCEHFLDDLKKNSKFLKKQFSESRCYTFLRRSGDEILVDLLMTIVCFHEFDVFSSRQGEALRLFCSGEVSLARKEWLQENKQFEVELAKASYGYTKFQTARKRLKLEQAQRVFESRCFSYYDHRQSMKVVYVRYRGNFLLGFSIHPEVRHLGKLVRQKEAQSEFCLKFESKAAFLKSQFREF